MVEEKVGFLCSLSTTLEGSNDHNETLLKSYYLMRCKDLSRGFGLPEKHFSTKVRCPHCCAEWQNFSNAKLKPLKFSKKQKNRIKSHKSNEGNSKNDMLHSNQLELICALCKHKTTTTCTKPEQAFKKTTKLMTTSNDIKKENNAKHGNIIVIDKSINNKHKKNKKQIDVYSNAKDIFSLQNKNNSIPSSIKTEPKIIKNNKKRKDKFAGLCKKAVLTVSQEKKDNKKDKLSLFLKPSAS